MQEAEATLFPDCREVTRRQRVVMVACLFNMFIGDAPNKDHPIQQRTTTQGLLAGGY